MMMSSFHKMNALKKTWKTFVKQSFVNVNIWKSARIESSMVCTSDSEKQPIVSVSHTTLHTWNSLTFNETLEMGFIQHEDAPTLVKHIIVKTKLSSWAQTFWSPKFKEHWWRAKENEHLSRLEAPLANFQLCQHSDRHHNINILSWANFNVVFAHLRVTRVGEIKIKKLNNVFQPHELIICYSIWFILVCWKSLVRTRPAIWPLPVNKQWICKYKQNCSMGHYLHFAVIMHLWKNTFMGWPLILSVCQ